MPLMRSWVETANSESCQFPLNNLPYGIFSVGGGQPRCGVAIGDRIFDATAAEIAGLLTLNEKRHLDEPNWNKIMGAGPDIWAKLRARLVSLLHEGSIYQQEASPFMVDASQVQLHMPFRVSEYTDFYAGRHHATNVGTMFRGRENALPPNWLHIPIGYNGRASSVVVSGTKVRRPWGQIKGPNDTVPRFEPSARFDIELEIGAIVGLPSTHGQPVTVEEADDMIFGYVLLNDWSARDIQTWEYQPLGPFQAKASATTISPWIVTKAALEPFRVSTPEREVELLAYLREPRPMLYDIKLEVALTPAGGEKAVISRTNYAEMYYSSAQQLAHHTTSGCPMNTGDLLGSGTISGPEPASRGSLLELSWGGKEPISISNVTRSFLEDNDTVTIRGQATGDGYIVGFGECTGQVVAPIALPRGEMN